MRKLTLKKCNRGQTALEYALVVGVIAVGLIFVGHKIFGTDDSPAADLMRKAVQSAAGTIAVNEQNNQ